MKKTLTTKNKQEETNTTYEPIAIIGMGCRFPGGANDPYTFWENLKNGVDCITETPKERWDISRHYSAQKKHSGKLSSKWGGYMDAIDEFDPAFFGITPREAEVMDPQQRKLLEVAWEAMEDAGQKPSELAGKPIGVFIGGFTSDYKILQFTNPEFDNLNAHSATGIMMTMLSNRLSYIFDFKGPSMSIDTACSSSLVAIHLACKSLQQGESKMAMAGGVLITLAPQYTISESKGGFLSGTGFSHAYDASANGYVRAEGAGIVLLKRLSDAIADGDAIHAVIKGTGVNQDGRTNGITVPNGDAQYQLMKATYAKAGIAPNTIQYVETHGTGTPVGDPIEANSVGRLISEGRKSSDKCYIGSVKTNIGHTESAAGIAGLIKVVMALKHKQIPAHLHLKNINPAIDIKNHAYEIPTKLTDWPETNGPATAGINSFGFGGTNSHLILQEYVPAATATILTEKESHKIPELKLFPITARAEDALTDAVTSYADFIKKATANNTALNDIAYSTSVKRELHSHRAAFSYKNTAELIEKLSLFSTGEQDTAFVKGKVLQQQHKKLVWVFSGMGPQWWGMGRQLYASEPVFKSVIDACDKEMSKHVKWSLIKELLADEADSKMAETWISQPANFAIQIALAALWRSYGIVPDAITGHSTGEAAAFYEAGVYSFKDAIKITINRSRLQHLLHGLGKMVAVGLSPDAVKPYIAQYKDAVSIAAVNSPSGLTLAGQEKALQEIAAVLTNEGIFNKFLQVEVPYHSVVMDIIKNDLIEVLADIKPQPTTTPLYSTVTGKLTKGTELDNHYWWKNVRDTVLFAATIQNIVDDGHSIFLEVGPHPALGGSITEVLEANQKTGTVLASLRRKENEAAQFTRSLGQLFTLGFEINWNRFYPHGNFVRLPKYPWRKDKYWTEPLFFNRLRTGTDEHTLLGMRRMPADNTWHSSVSLDKHPYLADHRIQGNGVFPAAGYIEMAYAALHAKWGKGCYVIENLSIDKAVFLTEEDTPNMKFILDEQNAKFRIVSADSAAAEALIVHTTGRFRKIQQNKLPETASLKELQLSLNQHFDASQFYSILNEFGYNYGPAFQAIKNIWTYNDQVLAQISSPEQIKDGLPDYYLHPSLLDACFQTLVFNEVNAPDINADATIRLPVKIERIRIDVAQLTELWCHTVITAKDNEKTTGTIYLYTNEGKPAGIIEGFIAQSIDTVANNIKAATIDSWLYKTEIQVAPVIEQINTITSEDKGYWVLFADEQGVADALATKLQNAGQHTCLVKPGEYFEMDRKAHAANISPISKEEISQLFTTLNEVTGLDCKGIIHLWNIDSPATDQLKGNAIQKAKRTGVHAVFQLAKVIQENELKGKLFVVTKNAQPYGSTDKLNAMAASVWGLGRVLAQKELTENWGRLIDIDITDGATSAQQLFNELQLNDKEQEVIYRNNERNVTRLVATTNLPPAFPTQLRADGSYLVTGAFGAIGRLVAHYLLQHGATKLILVSRSSLPERSTWSSLENTHQAYERVQFVKELEAKGAAVIVSEMDVTREIEVKEFLDNYKKQDQPPIRGLFFCAGLVKDTLLSKMDIASFDYVYSTKVTGSYILHSLLDNKELDHFVLFSSVAAQITTAGQTNYAAGNAFLDALAHYRRANGLPAVSINWGPWAIGMIKENNLVEHYKYQRGMNCILPEAGMQIMNRILGMDEPQYIVCDADWPVVLNWYENKPLLFAHLSADNKTNEHNTSGSFEDDYRKTAENQRFGFIQDKFTELVSNVLRCKKSAVEADSSLISIGLDSIMATELRNKIFGYFNETLPFVKLLSKATINQLAEELNSKLNVKITFDENLLPVTEVISANEDEVLITVSTTDQSLKKKVVDEFPLSYGQQAIWFIHAMQPESPAYNIGGAMHIPAAINIDALRKAIREVVQRHAALRTNFFIKDGKPYQRVYDCCEEDITIINVAGMDEAAIRERIITDNNKPYNLEKDTLYRIRLYQQAKDSNYFAVSIYHIISDAWSNYMFIDEMQAVYAKHAHNAPVQLPELTAGYKDFVSWEQQNISGEKGQQMLDFWKDNLPKEIPVLQLPFDRPRPKAQRNRGDSFTFDIDAKLTDSLKALSRSQGVTMYITLLGIYHLLMHKYSGQEDIIVGSPVSGRTNHQFDHVYGYFVNPLPVWANFKDNCSFSDFIQQLRNRVLAAIENQEYPFALLVNQLGIEHDASHSAVFQVLFVLLNHRVEQSHMDANNVAYYKGFPMHLMQIPEEEGQFDLTLTVYEENNAYKATMKYNTDLFNRETIEQFAMHYIALAKQIVSNPDNAISENLLVTVKERARILGSWKGVAKPLHKAVTIVEKIRDISIQLPENIACKMADDKNNTTAITYEALNKRSNQLANYLIQNGLKGNIAVGICLQKSTDLIIVITAVLKAGGYFVPLDPDQPEERINKILQNTKAGFIITDENYASNRAADIKQITLDKENYTAIAACSDNDPELLPHINDIAYVLYTSGSTGEPKGVMVTHANWMSIFECWYEQYELSKTAVHLQLANFNFDVFCGDFIRALACGKKLLLSDKATTMNIPLLLDIINDESVDVAEFVPSVIRPLINYSNQSNLKPDKMKVIIVGSDYWTISEYRTLQEICGKGTRVISSYGTTETTIDSSYFEGNTEQYTGEQIVPIGKPFFNTELFILDKYHKPVPAGVLGELYIGGYGVANGYIHAPELTAAKFITLQLDSNETHVYKTGDMARWCKSGNVILVERMDNQLKLRGQRIEPGEIESAAYSYNGITNVAALIQKDANKEASLCLYYTDNKDKLVNENALLLHLKNKLPNYMIPEHVIRLGEFPVNGNGKTDKKKLPLPYGNKTATAGVMPETLYEKKIAEIWRSILHVDNVSANDDFFALGGNSLHLIELLLQLQTAFNVKLAINQLYLNPGLKAIAGVIDNIVTGKEAGALPYQIYNNDQTANLFCFPPAGGFSMVYESLASALPNVKLISFNYLTEHDNLAYYIKEIKSIQPVGPYTLFGYSLGGNLAFEICNAMEKQGDEVTQVIIMDSYRITETVIMREQDYKHFEEELRQHFKKHVGSDIVENHVMAQAKHFITYSYQQKNVNPIKAELHFIMEDHPEDLNREVREQSWEAASLQLVKRYTGKGKHADMLDKRNGSVTANARLINTILEKNAVEKIIL